MAVVEFLTFRVPPAEMERWLELDERHWTRFLERQPGFVRKEVWRSADEADVADEVDVVHAVIWWASLADWKAVPAADLAAVSEAMGPHERTPTCVSYEVLRSPAPTDR